MKKLKKKFGNKQEQIERQRQCKEISKTETGMKQ